MVSVSKYLKDTEDTPFMYLYLVRRYKIFVSVATLTATQVSTDTIFTDRLKRRMTRVRAQFGRKNTVGSLKL